MATTSFNTNAQRIGKLKGEILKHAIPREVLGITGNQHKMGKNMSDTVVYRRWLPFGASNTNSTTINDWNVDPNAHLTQEGVTPNADVLDHQDITVQVKQYSCLYVYTDKTADLHEDDVPMAMKKQTGERMGLLREMIRYGALKANTNKFYAGGTTRGTVDEVISLSMIRRITRSIRGNRGDSITSILAPSANYNTTSVEAGYLVFCHTDAESDIRDMPGFVELASYGSRKPMHEAELGSVESFRFICSPELDPIADSGAAVGATGLVSTTGTSIDVYPIIVVAEDAWGDVALRGLNALDVTHIPHKKKDKSDPLGQRGYIGATFYSASFIQNDGWMAVAEVGVTDL